MNELLPLVLAFQFTLGGGAARDRWVAEDKVQHMFASFAATSMGYGAARAAGLGDGQARVAAAAAAATAGIAKEVHDRRAGRPFSTRDLVWDGLGIAAGLVLAARVR